MPHYQHDMLHCSQEQCKLKDKCYRFWLGENVINSGFQYASFYMPQNKEDIDNCKHFIDIKRLLKKDGRL